MTLSSLLDDVRTRFAPGDDSGLTNHLPMALIALQRLGASEAALSTFFESQRERLARYQPARPTPRAAELTSEIRARGLDEVLRERLRVCLPGLAGAGFHGIIRLAYGVMAKDEVELAHGLAYLEQTQLVLHAPRGSGQERQLSVLAQRLAEKRLVTPVESLIGDALCAVAEQPGFAEVVQDLEVDAGTLCQVSALGARWYLAADDFLTLHVVTAAHALRCLRPWTDDTAAADHALAVAALAAFVASGCPGRADARGRPRADDEELKAQALAATEPHLPKLVVSALDEELACEDSIFRIVATRAARRGSAV